MQPKFLPRVGNLEDVNEFPNPFENAVKQCIEEKRLKLDYQLKEYDEYKVELLKTKKLFELN